MSLSQKQYSVLADLAKKAWLAQPESVRAEYEQLAADHHNDPLVSAAKTFEFWRKEQQQKRTGKASMADMANRHFAPLKAMWLDLAAGKPAAFPQPFGDPTTYEDDRRRKLVALERDTRQAGLAWPDYPAAIARDQFRGRPLEALNGTELLRLIYTIKGRAKTKAKEAGA